jgi:hypothetical protein
MTALAQTHAEVMRADGIAKGDAHGASPCGHQVDLAAGASRASAFVASESAAGRSASGRAELRQQRREHQQRHQQPPIALHCCAPLPGAQRRQAAGAEVEMFPGPLRLPTGRAGGVPVAIFPILLRWATELPPAPSGGSWFAPRSLARLLEQRGMAVHVGDGVELRAVVDDGNDLGGGVTGH